MNFYQGKPVFARRILLQFMINTAIETSVLKVKLCKVNFYELKETNIHEVIGVYNYF